MARQILDSSHVKSKLRRGDTVMVIAGGHSTKRPNQGQTGKIVGFSGEYVVVEGVNTITKHQRQTAPGQPSGKIQREGKLHVSNVMFYADKLKRPVRLCTRTLNDGARVRGYVNPENGEFQQIVD